MLALFLALRQKSEMPCAQPSIGSVRGMGQNGWGMRARWIHWPQVRHMIGLNRVLAGCAELCTSVDEPAGQLALCKESPTI